MAAPATSSGDGCLSPPWSITAVSLHLHLAGDEHGEASQLRCRSTPDLQSIAVASQLRSRSTRRAPSVKVSDRIVNLSAIVSDGIKCEVIGLTGNTLLRALTDFGLIDPASHRHEEIETCSAECEVNIAEEWLEKLPPRTYEAARSCSRGGEPAPMQVECGVPIFGGGERAVGSHG